MAFSLTLAVAYPTLECMISKHCYTEGRLGGLGWLASQRVYMAGSGIYPWHVGRGVMPTRTRVTRKEAALATVGAAVAWSGNVVAQHVVAACGRTVTSD